MSDLIFNGQRGALPDEDSTEYRVLAACCDERAWPRQGFGMTEFEMAIERLRLMGWGFDWVTLH